MPGRVQGQQAGGVDLGRRLGDEVLHELLVAERPAADPARHRPLTHHVEGSMAGPDPPHGVMDAASRKALLGEKEALAGTSDEVGRGDPAVLKQDLGVAADVLAALPG